MKLRYIIASLVLGSLVFASCDDGISVPNTANKGKEKPTVATELKDSTDVEFTLTFTVSEDVASFGYVVYADSVAGFTENPSAFDIVSDAVGGTFAHGAAIVDSVYTVDVNIKCVLLEHYKVYAAAISKNGLLSEVDTLEIYIPGAHPDIEVLNAYYKLTPYTAEELADDANAACPGTPFQLALVEAAPSVYVLSGKLYGAFDVALVGSYDFSENTLTFDGSMFGDNSGSWFGGLVGYLDKTVPTAFAFFGGGAAGTDPIVFQCTVTDKKAKITSVKSGALDLSVYNGSTGSWKYDGLYGFFDEDCTIEFVEEITE